MILAPNLITRESQGEIVEGVDFPILENARVEVVRGKNSPVAIIHATEDTLERIASVIVPNDGRNEGEDEWAYSTLPRQIQDLVNLYPVIVLARIGEYIEIPDHLSPTLNSSQGSHTGTWHTDSIPVNMVLHTSRGAKKKLRNTVTLFNQNAEAGAIKPHQLLGSDAIGLFPGDMLIFSPQMRHVAGLAREVGLSSKGNLKFGTASAAHLINGFLE